MAHQLETNTNSTTTVPSTPGMKLVVLEAIQDIGGCFRARTRTAAITAWLIDDRDNSRPVTTPIDLEGRPGTVAVIQDQTGSFYPVREADRRLAEMATASSIEMGPKALGGHGRTISREFEITHSWSPLWNALRDAVIEAVKEPTEQAEVIGSLEGEQALVLMVSRNGNGRVEIEVRTEQILAWIIDRYCSGPQTPILECCIPDRETSVVLGIRENGDWYSIWGAPDPSKFYEMREWLKDRDCVPGFTVEAQLKIDGEPPALIKRVLDRMPEVAA